jgi:hypothetical protein
MFKTFLPGILIWLVVSQVWAQPTGLSFEDLLGLKRSGFSDSDVLAEIERTGTKLTLDAEQVTRLRAAGAGDALITRLTAATDPAPQEGQLWPNALAPLADHTKVLEKVSESIMAYDNPLKMPVGWLDKLEDEVRTQCYDQLRTAGIDRLVFVGCELEIILALGDAKVYRLYLSICCREGKRGFLNFRAQRESGDRVTDDGTLPLATLTDTHAPVSDTARKILAALASNEIMPVTSFEPLAFGFPAHMAEALAKDAAKSAQRALEQAAQAHNEIAELKYDQVIVRLDECFWFALAGDRPVGMIEGRLRLDKPAVALHSLRFREYPAKR